MPSIEVIAVWIHDIKSKEICKLYLEQMEINDFVVSAQSTWYMYELYLVCLGFFCFQGTIKKIKNKNKTNINSNTSRLTTLSRYMWARGQCQRYSSPRSQFTFIHNISRVCCGTTGCWWIAWLYVHPENHDGICIPRDVLKLCLRIRTEQVYRRYQEQLLVMRSVRLDKFR